MRSQCQDCRNVFWTMVAALLGTMSGVARAELPKSASGLSVQERAILEEYATNFQRLKECYDNIEIESIRRESLISALETTENPEGRRITRLVYRANGGGYYRMDVTPLDSRDQSPTGRSWIRLVRPEGWAIAERDGPDKPPVIVTWTDNRDEGLKDLSAYVFQWSPYSMHVFPMKLFILGEPFWLKDYEVERVLSNHGSGDRLVTITARGKAKRGETGWRGSFVFYRDRAWALKEIACGYASLTTPEAYVQKGRYEYEGSREGVPLLKRVEYWREYGLERKRTVQEVFEIVALKVGPVPEEEFSPAVLGVEAVGQRSHWVRLMLGMLGAVLLLLLYFFLRRKERKSAG